MRGNLLPTSIPNSTLTEPCLECYGSGMMVTETGAKPCGCRMSEVEAKLLAKIPPAFAHGDLATLEPRVDQRAIVERMRANPAGSYIFAGRFGTGKSLLMWALYREAVKTNPMRIVACTLSELMDEYRKTFDNPEFLPRIGAYELRRNGPKYSLFLDDIDKARPTEYVGEQVFELTDAIYAFQHQIVATTNLSVPKLIEHFERADERYGGAIVRRLLEVAEIVELF